MDDHTSLVEALTARENEILTLIADGCSYAEIGERLYIEKTTVKWYVQEMYDKLGLETVQRNQRQLVELARKLGILTAEPALSSMIPAVPNPYKGLRPFQLADAGNFFGREALIQHLLSRLAESGEASRFLA